MLGDNWRVLDPLAAVIVSLFIVKVALQLVIPAINDLLEKSLPKEVEDEILAIISEVPEVKSRIIYVPAASVIILLSRRIYG